MGKIVGLVFEETIEGSVGDELACAHCGKEYKSEAALDKHIREKHPDMDER